MKHADKNYMTGWGDTNLNKIRLNFKSRQQGRTTLYKLPLLHTQEIARSILFLFCVVCYSILLCFFLIFTTVKPALSAVTKNFPGVRIIKVSPILFITRKASTHLWNQRLFKVTDYGEALLCIGSRRFEFQKKNSNCEKFR